MQVMIALLCFSVNLVNLVALGVLFWLGECYFLAYCCVAVAAAAMTAALWYWDSEFMRVYSLLFLCLLYLLCLLHLLCFCNCYDCFSVCSEVCTLFFLLFLFFSDLVMAASAAVIVSIISIDVQTEMFETHICALIMWDDCRVLNTLRNYKRLIEKWKMCSSSLSLLFHSILLGFDLLLICFARYDVIRRSSQTAS